MRFYPVLFFAVFFLWTNANDLSAQTRAQLEKKRREINREINRINSDLKKTKSKEKNALTVYELIKRKVTLRQKLINNLNREIQRLDRIINRKNDSLEMLNDELRLLKKNYAEAVRNMYKFSSKEKVLYFILSSESFRQAWRRMRYIKEYSDFVKKKAESIKEKEQILSDLVNRLEKKKAEKKNLLTTLSDEQRQLKQEQIKQEEILARLRKQKRKYIALIRKKQREARRIDKMIEKLIAEEIARSNRKAGKRSREFVLTPEGKKLAAAFAANQGRLPWPVKRGYVSRRFGKQRHPVYKNVTVTNSGIYINVPDNEKARAVFNGEVMMIQVVPGGNQSVFVRHGNYITIYGNLKEVYVKKGQKVKTGQTLGIVGKDISGNISVLKFRIYKNRTKLNPELWLARK
jgi:septal ring factor EnvC (AmiA/AmiB activator)